MKKSRSEIETELKISLSREDLERVFDHFSQKPNAGRIEHKFLPRAYYDTAGLDLHAAGLSLRIQYKPGKSGKLGSYEQTVKFEFGVGQDALIEGAMQRKECKNQLSSPQPDMEAVVDADAVNAITPFKNKSLKHIFTAAIERRYFNLPVARGTVELAFDIGEIILQPSGANHPFAEIEIEVKAGSPAIIAAVRDKILKLAPSAKVQPLSKSQQGTQLFMQAKKPKI